MFQGRFKSLLVDEDVYFLKLTRYIHLNPVRANVVELPQKFKWSSYGGYTKPKIDKYIDYHELNKYMTISLSKYKNFVLDGIGKREAMFDDVYAGFFLGSKDFIEEKIEKFKPEIESGDFAHKRKLQTDITIDDIIKVASKIFKASKAEIIAKKHSASFNRKVVIYIVRRITPFTNKQIGNYFGICDTAVIKAEGVVAGKLAKDKLFKTKVDEILSAFRV